MNAAAYWSPPIDPSANGQPSFRTPPCATTWDLPTPGAPHRKAGLRIRVSSCSEDAISDGFMGFFHDGPPRSLSPGYLPVSDFPRPSHSYRTPMSVQFGRRHVN